MMDTTEIFASAHAASLSLQLMEESQVNAILSRLADMTLDNADEILAANREDLSRMSQDNPMYDRLLLDKARIEAIAADLRNVAGLPSPVGTVLDSWTRPNGSKRKPETCPKVPKWNICTRGKKGAANRSRK